MNIQTFQQNIPKLGEQVFVHAQACIIGNVIIGNDSSIWPFASIRGDMHAIKIGQRTSIQDGCVLHVTHDRRIS